MIVDLSRVKWDLEDQGSQILFNFYFKENELIVE